MLTSIPDGMTSAQFRSHPVYTTIRHAAYGGERALPTTAQLDALKLSPTARKLVRDACRQVADLHAAGTQQDAWALGDELSVAILEGLSEEQRDPRNFEERQPLETMDAGELADLIPR
jgi:hypothetical protein